MGQVLNSDRKSGHACICVLIKLILFLKLQKLIRQHQHLQKRQYVYLLDGWLKCKKISCAHCSKIHDEWIPLCMCLSDLAQTSTS